MNKLKLYVLDFCLTDEPMHILMGAVLDGNVCNAAIDIVDPLFSLVREGLVGVRRCTSVPWNRWVVVDQMSREELCSYIKKHGTNGFSEHPESEYYVQTTARGRQILEQHATS